MQSKATLRQALTLMLLIIVWLNLSGQTNPTAQTLPYTQNFGTSGFSAMPTGMACWAATPTPQSTLAAAESSTPNVNQAVTSGAPTATGGPYGHSPSSNGRVTIVTSSNNTGGSSQVVASVVTTGLSSVTVTYSLVLSVTATRDVGVVLQYRNGTTGAFTTISGSNVTYNSGTSNGGDADGAADFDNYTFTLPAAALNQAVVQLRWATWRGTQAGASAGIGLDNISITGSAAATPSIVASPTSITGLNYFIGSGPSAAQSTSVSATNLSPATAVVTVTAPSNFQVSVSGSGSWGTTGTLTASGGSIASTNVFFRLVSGLSANNYTGTATLAGGTATTVSVTLAGTVSASSSSDIVANGTASAISSLTNAATISNNTQGTQVWSLTVRDGGAGLNDADNLPTIVTAVTLTATSFVGNTFVFPNAIQSIAIFNGSTLLANGVVSGTTNDDSRVVFTFASPLTVTDNASVNLDIRLSVKTNFAGVDNDDFVFIVSSANVSSSASGSGFAAFTTFNSGNNVVRVQVVATELRFLQQPTTVAAGATMSPAVTVRGTNVYGYTDSDFVRSVSVTSGGTLTSTPATSTASLGVATFSALVHTLPIDNITLTATATGLTLATSSLFTVTDIPALSAGDILFTYANADGDGFEFMTLKRLDLSALKFTDNGICSNGSFRKNEDDAIITNGTSWTDVPQGTMIRVAMDGTGTAETNAIDGYIFSSTGTTSGLNAGGEQILGYLGASNGGADCTGSGSNTFVAGIDWGNTGGWTSGATASSNSKIPGTPTDFSTASNNDVSWYTGTVLGDASTISSTANVRNSANWTGTSTGTAFNGTNLTIKNIQFNESNYTSGAVSVTNISCDATAVTVDCSALVFANTTESTRYIIVANPNSAGSAPVDKYTCYSNVTGNFATAPTVVTAVSGQTKIDGCGTPTTGSGKVVYFDYRLRSNTVISGLTAGQNYTLSVYAVNGNGLTSNMSSNTVSVSVTPAVTNPTVTIGGATTACAGSTLTLTASGASSYTWTGGQTTASATFNASGTYRVTGTNASGCTATTETTVTINANPTVTIGGATTACAGSTLTLTASGASSYVWTGGQATASATFNASGTYRVTGTNASGCTATTETPVTINANPTVTIGGATTACAGSTLTLTASGASSYVWTGGQTTASATFNASGTYRVTGTNASGCTSTTETPVTINANPTVTLSGTNPACGTVTLTANGANNYAWSTGGNTGIENFTNGGVTAFTVTGTDVNGCTATFASAATVNNSSYNIALATTSDNGQILLQSCEEGPWTYYADPDNGKYYFAIKWDPSNIGSGHNLTQKNNAQVKTFVNASLYGVTAAATTGTTAQPPKGTWVMSRGWNVTNAGTLDGNVDVRFFYDAAELSSIQTAASNFVTANPTSNLEPLTWFKTVGTDYDPTEVANGNRINAEGVYRGASLILTPVFGSINGIEYAEFNTASFSGGGAASGAGANGNPLPIKLEYFRGEKNGEKANLTWRTQTEENSSHFVLERSANGTDFYAVGNVLAAGNSSSPKLYQWTDEHTLVGSNYYRLRQIDSDGTFVLSNVVVLNFESASQVDVFPNPFSSTFVVDIYTLEETESKIEVFDMSGRLLDIQLLNLTAGTTRSTIDGSRWTPGAYLVKVTAVGFTTHRTIVKTKF